MQTPNFDPRDPAFYNPIINGNMDFWQRGTTQAKTHVSNITTYTMDKSRTNLGPTATKSITINRSTDLPSGLPYPANYSYEMVNNTAIASFGSVDYVNAFNQSVEGQILQPIGGKDFTLGFWMYSSLAIANFPIAITSATFGYVTHVAAASGWNYYSVQIPWHSSMAVYNTTAALSISVGFVGGSTFQIASLNTWTSGLFFTHSTSTNFYSGTATLRFAQVQIRGGYFSSEEMKNSFTRTGLTYQQELALCQRYFEKSYALDVAPGSVSSAVINNFRNLGNAGDSRMSCGFVVSKRTAPLTIVTYNSATGASGNWNGFSTGMDTVNQNGFVVTVSSQTANAYAYGHWTADAEF